MAERKTGVIVFADDGETYAKFSVDDDRGGDVGGEGREAEGILFLLWCGGDSRVNR